MCSSDLEQNLLHAVEHISIERGYAPGRFALVAAGGAGPMHGTQVARGLGCQRVYVPRDAGALCAVGMLHADVRRDFQRFLTGSLGVDVKERVDQALAELSDDALAAMAEEGFGAEAVRLDRELDLHYPGQLWSIRVPAPDGAFDAGAMRGRFEAEYEQIGRAHV